MGAGTAPNWGKWFTEGFLSNIIPISNSAGSPGPAGLLPQDETPMSNGIPTISWLRAPLDHPALPPTPHQLVSVAQICREGQNL